jgi:hypothetical protein
LRNVGTRPSRFSIPLTAERSSRGVPVQRIRATALKNAGWSAYPTGSER